MLKAILRLISGNGVRSRDFGAERLAVEYLIPDCKEGQVFSKSNEAESLFFKNGGNEIFSRI